MFRTFCWRKENVHNNTPSIVPKTAKQTPITPRSTLNSSGAKRRLISPVRNATTELENEPNIEEQLNTEVELLKTELKELKQDITTRENELQATILNLQNLLEKSKFNIDRFKHNQAHFKFYTGFENYKMFQIVLEYLQPAAGSLIYWGSNTNIENKISSTVAKRGPPRTLSAEDEFFLVLVRLRCAFPIEDLSVRFDISTSNLSRILITWIDFLHAQVRMLPVWASKETVIETMPKCFKDAYPTTRVILDCTEIFIEMPTSYRSQSATFSNYKHHNTAKGLVGIAPNGAVTFVSDLYAGRTSDKKLTLDSGIYKLLEPGDSVMADRGFEIEDDLPDNVSLNIPPFLNGKPQLSLQEENETRKIASVRVHVERAIERVKNYRILQTVFPLSMAPELNKIWIICCYLVNFLPPLVVDKEER